MPQTGLPCSKNRIPPANYTQRQVLYLGKINDLKTCIPQLEPHSVLFRGSGGFRQFVSQVETKHYPTTPVRRKEPVPTQTMARKSMPKPARIARIL